jgi:hypothetical protein
MHGIVFCMLFSPYAGRQAINATITAWKYGTRALVAETALQLNIIPCVNSQTEIVL